MQHQTKASDIKQRFCCCRYSSPAEQLVGASLDPELGVLNTLTHTYARCNWQFPISVMTDCHIVHERQREREYLAKDVVMQHQLKIIEKCLEITQHTRTPIVFALCRRCGKWGWERKDKNKHTARTNVQRLNILSGSGTGEWHSFFACCKPFFDFYIFCSALHFITSHSLCCLVSYFIHDSLPPSKCTRLVHIWPNETKTLLSSTHPSPHPQPSSLTERIQQWNEWNDGEPHAVANAK